MENICALQSNKKKRKNYFIDFSQEVLETEMRLLVKLVDRCLPLVIFPLKNYITFVLISLIQTENVNNKLITMTLKITKSPALTLVLVVPPYFPPPLEKKEVEGREKKRNYMDRKNTFGLYVCVDHFSTTKIKRNIKKGKAICFKFT